MANNNKHNHFPWSHVIGFAFSILLTLLAVWVALETDLSRNTIFWIIGGLAMVQAAIQLIMFMHLREGEGTTQVVNMLFSFFIAAVIVAGSVWVMMSTMQDMDMDNMEMDNMNEEQGHNMDDSHEGHDMEDEGHDSH